MTSFAVRAGQVVRCELEPRGIWFYCRVDEIPDDGDLVCTIVDAQSWPDMILDGYAPGRQYRLARHRVLSVVREE
jgi:hypothetical protein